jgi:hypothetical protein
MNELLDERQAAKSLGCSIGMMRKFRLLGCGPAFCKIGRLVRYRQEDLIAYVESNRITEGEAR